MKVGVVKEPQRDNDTGLQVVIKELAERLRFKAWNYVLMVPKQDLGNGNPEMLDKSSSIVQPVTD